MWSAFPPLGWWPLGWVAPVFWLGLVQRKQLAGRRPYLKLWLAGAAYWLALFYFIPLPHPALFLGWLALAGYMGVYLPLFVGLTRVAVHRLGISLVLAAPATWIGFELIRGHLFSGLSMALLGHTQVKWPMLIQISDLFGAYGVSFLVLLVAAAMVKVLPWNGKWRIWALAPAVVLIAASLAYGSYRLNETPPLAEGKTLNVALIQGSIDTVLADSQEDARRRREYSFEQYREVTSEARKEFGEIDLLIWPEGKFPYPDQLHSEDVTSLEKIDHGRIETSPDFIGYALAAKSEGFERPISDLRMLVGTQTALIHDAASASDPPSEQFDVFNTALLIGPEGHIEDRYFKMHRVPFGEYILFGDWFPWLYKVTPIPMPLRPGVEPRAFEVGGFRLSPNICFESTVPHLIRRQVARLARDGKAPDLLINITDDGWFRGSSCLDMHLTCSVFRSIENRKPTLIAANTGFSAWIDGNGRILEKGPRRNTGRIYVQARRDGRRTFYQWSGDWLAGLGGAFCLVCAVTGVGLRRREKVSRKN